MAFDFHHLDPMEKDFSISDRMTSFEAIVRELAKCVLLCARCHREVHDGWHPSFLAGDNRGYDPDLEGDEDLADLHFPALLEECRREDVFAADPTAAVVLTGTGGSMVSAIHANHVPTARGTLNEVDVGRPIARLDIGHESDGPADAGTQLRVPSHPSTGETLDGPESRREIESLAAHGGTTQYTDEDQTLDAFLGVMTF